MHRVVYNVIMVRERGGAQREKKMNLKNLFRKFEIEPEPVVLAVGDVVLTPRIQGVVYKIGYWDEYRGEYTSPFLPFEAGVWVYVDGSGFTTADGRPQHPVADWCPINDLMIIDMSAIDALIGEAV